MTEEVGGLAGVEEDTDTDLGGFDGMAEGVEYCGIDSEQDREPTSTGEIGSSPSDDICDSSSKV